MQLRVVAVPLVALGLCAFAPSCEKKPDPSATTASSSTPYAETRSAAVLLRGTWQVDSFSAAAPSGSASAAELAAAVEADELARAIRVIYTGDQVKTMVPGQPTLTSSYEVKSDSPTRVVLKNGPDDVIITFRDDDHMTIDRKGNAFGSKMSMKRVKDAPPIPSTTQKPQMPQMPVMMASGSGSASGYPLEMPKGTIMKVGPEGTVLIFPDGGRIPINK